MDDDYLMGQVRGLREKGLNPKQVARALGIPPATAAGIIRAVAAADAVALPDPAERELRQCWVNSGWSAGLTVDNHPEWRDGDESETGGSGLVSVLIVRDAGRSRLSLCGYLVDVYCLGVKNVVGPLVMTARQSEEYTGQFFGAYPEPPLAASLDLAQDLVFGAVEYARSLGFEPAAEFDDAKGHLGTWCGSSAIRFGRNGRPFFVEGPYDDGNHIIRQLQRSVGRKRFEYMVSA